tara:strand:+ start:2054 stop:2431 length:378 start_codon:yes stop_codon:yes gene_type:complete
MDKKPKITQGKIVKKGWGHELHIENNEDYCGKLLVFNKGKKFSMHYHIEKYETWFVQKGKLKFSWINPEDASLNLDYLKEGCIVTIYQGISHQLEALEDSIIFEISTQDKLEDSYRVWKGDSQKY